MVSFKDAVKMCMVRTKKGTRGAAKCQSWTQGDIIWYLFLNRRTTTWNLIVSYAMKKQIVVNGEVIYASVLQ